MMVLRRRGARAERHLTTSPFQFRDLRSRVYRDGKGRHGKLGRTFEWELFTRYAPTQQRRELALRRGTRADQE